MKYTISLLFSIFIAIGCLERPIAPEDTRLNLKIESPTDSIKYTHGDTIEFKFVLEDPKGNEISEYADLEWVSDKDGVLSNEAHFKTHRLTATTHKINLKLWVDHETLIEDTIFVTIKIKPDITVLVAGSKYWLDNLFSRGAPNQTGSLNEITHYGAWIFLVGTADSKPAYWNLNDNYHTLSEINGGEAYSIHLETRRDFYICGTDRKSLLHAPKACYWHNESQTFLSGEQSVAKKIRVWEDDIYVAGEERGKACLWVNETKTLLFDSLSQVTDMDIDNGDVYICGFVTGQYDNFSSRRAFLWKNDEATIFDSVHGFFSDMEVVNGNVYLVGEENYESAYWINGDKYSVPYPKNLPPELTAISIYNNIIFIGGVYDVSGRSKPCYWRDGLRVDLTGTYASVNSIKATYRIW